MQKEQHPIRGYLLIAAASFCYGGSATLGKAVFRGMLAQRDAALPQIDALILAQARSTLSLLILIPILLAWRGRKSLLLSRADVLRCMLLGIMGVAASNFFYYYAIDKTSVATAIIIQYTAPVWVLFYMVWRKIQRATLQRTMAVVLAFVGSALSIGIVGVTGASPFIHVIGIKLNALGVGAALMAAFSFAFYSTFGQFMVTRHDRWKVIAYAMMGAAIFWMVINPPWKIIAAHYSREQWIFLLVFSIASMLLPLSLYFAGLQQLDATRAIVTSCLEPVFAILFVATFVHESLGAIQMVGIFVVLAASVVVQLPERSSTDAISQTA
ncbi:MAG: putative 10 drug/metabolite exporter, family, superfamily [Acidobacteriales bacterium]|nr:putative 10 drug/metabolite exporter, family, superfamily [Terriglobales bacterium]